MIKTKKAIRYHEARHVIMARTMPGRTNNYHNSLELPWPFTENCLSAGSEFAQTKRPCRQDPIH